MQRLPGDTFTFINFPRMRIVRLSVFFVLTALFAGAQTHEGITIKEVFIPMSDGIKLAADLYLPENLAGGKLPVLLEYLPYRKDEGRGRRFGLYAYFVKRGYIIARVDIRGTGNSEGELIPYEYSEIEQQDGEVVIDWLAKQAFSTGEIGMFGISWGGFNSIQMAMRQPPALKAIIALMATDDMYEDDVHFMDGMMHIDAYEIGQDLANAMPGAPEFKIDEKYFANRFETTPWLLQYKKQQRDGPFWDRASLNRDYGLIKIPAFLIGGWYDGYRDAIPRMLENIKSPLKAMIGPWNHTFPNWADPPPAIEWRADAVRWFDHWLKGADNGIMDEPRFAAFIRDGHAPGTNVKEITGSWRWENNWPSPQVADKRYYLQQAGGLAEREVVSSKKSLNYVPSVGPEAGGSVMWWGDWSPDQGRADSLSMVFETEPLSEDVTVFGFPKAHLSVSANAPLAHWMVRLNDVSPAGQVTLVTGAGANGTHRQSAADPTPIKKNEVFPLKVELHFTSWTFKKGHRIRVAVNNAQWPMIWPTPYTFTSTLYIGGSNGSGIDLPVAGVSPWGGPRFPDPEESPKLSGYSSIEGGTNSGFAEVDNIMRDPKTGTTTVKLTNGGGDAYPWGKIFYDEKINHIVNDRDPARVKVESHYQIRAEVGSRKIAWEGILLFESDQKNFYYTYTRKLTENGKLLRTKTWKETIKRDFQ